MNMKQMLIQRVIPRKKGSILGSLFVLRLLPGWALTAFIAAFAWTLWARSNGSRPRVEDVY